MSRSLAQLAEYNGLRLEGRSCLVHFGCIVGKPEVMARIRSIGITSGLPVIRSLRVIKGDTITRTMRVGASEGEG